MNDLQYLSLGDLEQNKSFSREETREASALAFLWGLKLPFPPFPFKRLPRGLSTMLLTVFPRILKVDASKEEKQSLSVFVHTKAKEDNKIVLQRVGFEISRERQGFLLQSRKMAKR